MATKRTGSLNQNAVDALVTELDAIDVLGTFEDIELVETPPKRIGTWNLDARWSPAHEAFLRALDCDLLLLTEVSPRMSLAGYHFHRTKLAMKRGQHWAAVLSREPLVALPDPHGASALALVGGMRVCSSILPWRSCGAQRPWLGATTFAKTEHAIESIARSAPRIWGGDWNHAFVGDERAGSLAGREALRHAASRLKLEIPTADAPHHLPALRSIDHIAVPNDWATEVDRHVAGALSDHDAYVVVRRSACYDAPK